jgi:DNA-binding Lrp family transcriptional regulator
MSKGPWKKETRIRNSGEIEKLRQARLAERDGTDGKIEAAIERCGALSVFQLMQETGLSKSTIANAIDRLRRSGLIRMLPNRRRVGMRGNLACIYDLGVEDEAPIKRSGGIVIVQRHPYDVALFGEYRKAA